MELNLESREIHGLHYCKCSDPRRAHCQSCAEDYCAVCGGRIVGPATPPICPRCGAYVSADARYSGRRCCCPGSPLCKFYEAICAKCPLMGGPECVPEKCTRKIGEVSAKADKLWAELDNKATQGSGMAKKRCQNSDNISATDAGFGDRNDAMVCARIGELTLEERKAAEPEGCAPRAHG